MVGLHFKMFDTTMLSPERALTYYLAFGEGPLITRSTRDLAIADWEGYRGWGDVYLDWVAEEAARESPEKRHEREAKEATAAAEKARLEPMIELHHAQQNAMIARSRNSRNKDRVGFKDARPCRALYDYSREHGCCQTRHISTECWAHEFTDALTTEFLDSRGCLTKMAVEYGIPRAIQNKSAVIRRGSGGVYTLVWTPHTCWMTHPGEPGWNPVWETDRNVQPAPAPAPPQQQPQRNQRDWPKNSFPQRRSEPPQNGFTGPRRDFGAMTKRATPTNRYTSPFDSDSE